MSKQSVGTLFKDYQQYCDMVDEALASLKSPLMNGLPMAKAARRQILNKRLSYVRHPEYLLVLSAHDGYFKLYYTALESAVMEMPQTNTPIVADQVRLDDKAYPQHEALMERSMFKLGRVNVGMERKLDETLKKELYLHEELPANITVGFAMPGELYRVNKLLRNLFDPMLDELPSRDELNRIISDGHVFVIRDSEKIAAVMVRISKGSTAMMHWIAVDPLYRNYKLSGLLHYSGDADSKAKGYHQVAIWIDAEAEGWVQAVQRRGYQINHQRLYTYVYHP